MAASLNELATLTSHAALTMVVSAEHTGENRAFDSHINRMLAEAESLLTTHDTKRGAGRIIRSVRQQVDALDRAHLSQGVWIGAIDDYVAIHHLDDVVEPNLTVSTRLNLLPLVRQSRRTNALVLLLTETGCTLIRYHTSGETLEQRMRALKVPGFPARFGGEGGRQARDAGSDQRDDRYRQWLREVSHIAAQAHATIPAVSSLPLIVVGVDRYIGFLAEVSSNLHISGVIHGSPDAFTASELDRRLAAEVDRMRNDESVATLARIYRALGAGRTSVDASETLAWADLGRVDTLVVEEGTESDEILQIALRVLSKAGRVISAPRDAIAAEVPALGAARWVALLRW